jgi:hypothetical protein
MWIQNLSTLFINRPLMAAEFRYRRSKQYNPL